MPLDTHRFGEKNEAGTVISEPEVCALTGRPLQPGDVTVNLSNTNYFAKVKASIWRQKNPVARDEARGLLRRQALRSVNPVEYAPDEEMEDIPDEGEN